MIAENREDNRENLTGQLEETAGNWQVAPTDKNDLIQQKDLRRNPSSTWQISILY